MRIRNAESRGVLSGVGGLRMPRYSVAQLNEFRRNSRCEDCVHYAHGCPLWMAVLLANEEEITTPGLDLFVDIEAPCPMFFAAVKEPS